MMFSRYEVYWISGLYMPHIRPRKKAKGLYRFPGPLCCAVPGRGTAGEATHFLAGKLSIKKTGL